MYWKSGGFFKGQWRNGKQTEEGDFFLPEETLSSEKPLDYPPDNSRIKSLSSNLKKIKEKS